MGGSEKLVISDLVLKLTGISKGFFSARTYCLWYFGDSKLLLALCCPSHILRGLYSRDFGDNMQQCTSENMCIDIDRRGKCQQEGHMKVKSTLSQCCHLTTITRIQFSFTIQIF